MFISRHEGAISTTVHAHPIKLLIFALALMLIAGAMIEADKLWPVAGAGALLIAALLSAVATRQIIRGVRAFFS
jgi:hypothetical protein